MKVNPAVRIPGEPFAEMLEKEHDQWTSDERKCVNLDNVAKNAIFVTLDKGTFSKAFEYDIDRREKAEESPAKTTTLTAVSERRHSAGPTSKTSKECCKKNAHSDDGMSEDEMALMIKKFKKYLNKSGKTPFKAKMFPKVMTCLSFLCELSGVHNVNLYSYKELRIATDDFSPVNKIGEGGFGSVYKILKLTQDPATLWNKYGKLRNGRMAAIKVLSSESRQGAIEFLTEIQVISDVEHVNLVRLYGCCVEGNHRILVYNYLENNSLAHTLLVIEGNWQDFGTTTFSAPWN
ncbi:hypothetical protein OROGR_001496 [Orobanche gracilis]